MRRDQQGFAREVCIDVVFLWFNYRVLFWCVYLLAVYLRLSGFEVLANESCITCSSTLD